MPPLDFDHLIASCLEKDRSRRPASAAAVADSLRRPPANGERGPSSLSSRETIRSIAVLPFRNVSQDPTQEYFADGMTEAVISDLARIRALRVISRTSAMKYKGTALSLPEIARELNVDAMLEGSAHLVGGRVRVNVQLIAARTDETLWTDRYDRQLEDVLALQSELAETGRPRDRRATHADRGHTARAPSRREPGGASRIFQGTAFSMGRIARRRRTRPPSREARARHRSEVRRGVVGTRRLPHDSRDARDGAAGRGGSGRPRRPHGAPSSSIPRSPMPTCPSASSRCTREICTRPSARCAMPSN